MNIDIIKCPKCNKSNYTHEGMFSTCMYFKPIIVNGVNTNPDRNWNFEHCRCNECGEVFTIISRHGDKTQVKSGRRDYMSKDKD